MTRIRLFAVVAVLVLAAVWVRAQSIPTGFEHLAISTTAVGITSTTYRQGNERASLCIGILESGAIRYTSDGTTPTASVGHALAIGQQIKIEGLENITGFQAIRSGSTDGALPLTCYR